MQNSLISVAMATYNGERFIAEQLESILNQTYKNIEVIVCDDASSDATVSILKAFAQKDARVRLIENKSNLGYVKNFEKAISLCRGEYIALADQDDIWMEEKLAILKEEIGSASLIHSDAYLIDANGNVFSHSYTQYERKYLHPKNIVELIFNPAVTGCSVLFTKALQKKILPFCKEIYVHDLWISMIAFKEQGIKYCDKPLLQYRQHGGNQIGISTTAAKGGDRCLQTRLFYQKQKSKLSCLFSKQIELSKEEYKLALRMHHLFFYFERANPLGFVYLFQVIDVIDKKLGAFKKVQKFLKYFIKTVMCRKERT